MNKKDILNKIKSLDGLNQDERAYLVNLVNTKKKYGLVWEDKHEDVEEQLRTKLPVLQEVKERAIINDNVIERNEAISNNKTSSSPLGKLDGDNPNHILIEGDNLHALTALTFTHENKIDLIYIDPPYNTGNKDFIYNDHYVDKEDAYRHSKWISFMEKRLRIAHKLLKDDGVIFISIDDNEQANLVVLCNEVFGFAGTHEYTLVYAKNRKLFNPNELPYDPEELEKWAEDEIGYFKKGAPLRATGTEARRENRPNMFYPILVKKDKITTIEENEYQKIYNKELKTFDDDFVAQLTIKYEKKGYNVVWPKVNDDTYGRWRWGFSLENKNRLQYDGIVNTSGKSITLYKKQRPSIGDIPSKKPKSLFYRPEYSSGNGTTQLKNILGGKFFDNPKPRDLLLDILRIGAKEGSIVLDFFAGSGTTLDAILHLNKIEKQNIQGLIVTNNENDIAIDVTYKRIEKLINGYKTQEALKNNNLRYYKTAFVDREPSLQNKRQLTQLATELLCIKEDCYTEVTITLGKEAWHKLFTNNQGQYVYVIYDDMYIEEAVDTLTKFVAKQAPESKIKVYVFANGQYAYHEEFEDIADNITLAALPDAIYKTYQNVLPKENKDFVPELEKDAAINEANNLFNQA